MAKSRETNDPALSNNCDETSSNIAQCSNSSENTNNLDHVEEDNSTGPPDNSYADFSTNEVCRMDVDSVKELQNKVNTGKSANEQTNNVPTSNSSDSRSAFNDGHNTVDYVNADNQKGGESVYAADDDSEDEDESEDESTDEDGTVGSEEPRAEDTVSINSDSEPEDNDSTSDIQTNAKNSDVIILGNLDRNGDNANGSQSPQVHEIVSDNEDDPDCVMTDEKSNSNSGSVQESQVCAVKRKNYNAMENGDDESDIEEVSSEDPLSQFRSRLPRDTKALINMNLQQVRAKKFKELESKKDPTVVIIDTNAIMSGKGPVSLSQVKSTVASPSMSPQSLYQSIAARGTTVTPVTTKHTSAAVQTSQQPLILPSLTNDMYVVEAPSFIVPYVYEKPSVYPFKEYMILIGEELEKEKAILESIRLEKMKAEKEKREKERKERGEESEKEEPEESVRNVDINKEAPEEKIVEAAKTKKLDKKNRKRGVNDEDDASWDGDSSMDSEEEAISDDDVGTTVVLKEKADDSLENLKTSITADLTEPKPQIGVKSDNYFENALGKFFTNIGLNLVQEFVQSDLMKQQKRKLQKEIKSGGTNTKPMESAIISLTKNLEFSKENNAPYHFQQKKCKFCSFKTESMLVMAHHLETPHMKNNVYNCNFCSFEIKSPHDILYHMEEEHNTRGRLERAPAYHQCANCPFEDNGKGKLARHLIPCTKKFKPELNLAPPAEWEPPAKIPKITRARNTMMNSYQAAFNRAPVGTTITPRQPISMSNILPGVVGNYRARSRSPMGASSRGAPPHGTPMLRGNMMMRHSAPSQQLISNYPILQSTQGSSKMGSKILHQPSISITPLPRTPQTAHAMPLPPTKGTFVICEVCDGYIKDLEQLRNHMQWIHKVKIHPKMIYNRPPLNCQKCQFRFFTDQGLERHLLGSHGLVTSSMQEAANKGKDSGRCPVCGRVYQWKLLNHVARDHNLTLKPAHLSYKCTVCTATFGMYKLFENHVYSAHSVVAKRVMDKNKNAAPASKPQTSDASLLKPLKINDEITIIPQPSSAPVPTSAKGIKD